MEYIYEAHDILPKELCQEIIEKFENDPDKLKGYVGNGIVENKTKVSTDLHLKNPEWYQYNELLNKYLMIGISKYFKYLLTDAYCNLDHILEQRFGHDIINSNFQIQKYEIGGKFEWHIDDSPLCKRLFAFIIYLNDNDGCTEFKLGKKVKPETGKILIFPSTWTYPHKGSEIKEGVKYIITGFISEYDHTI
jgi:hypothetical protein|tara:strand:- start:1758 stop:2333 length:576 start_codon:yes stop_codon:yes gene_type:complete